MVSWLTCSNSTTNFKTSDLGGEVMNWQTIVGLILLDAAAIAFCVWWWVIRPHRQRDPQYHIRVTCGNVVHRLTLNEDQYPSFAEWLNRPDGFFEIGDDQNRMFLERRSMAAAEVRRR